MSYNVWMDGWMNWTVGYTAVVSSSGYLLVLHLPDTHLCKLQVRIIPVDKPPQALGTPSCMTQHTRNKFRIVFVSGMFFFTVVIIWPKFEKLGSVNRS